MPCGLARRPLDTAASRLCCTLRLLCGACSAGAAPGLDNRCWAPQTSDWCAANPPGTSAHVEALEEALLLFRQPPAQFDAREWVRVTELVTGAQLPQDPLPTRARMRAYPVAISDLPPSGTPVWQDNCDDCEGKLCLGFKPAQHTFHGRTYVGVASLCFQSYQ